MKVAGNGIPGGWGAHGGRIAAAVALAGLLLTAAAARAQGSAIGCADGTREGLVDTRLFPRIAACAGTWTGHVSNAEGLCAPGWAVCSHESPELATVTFSQATAFPGCFAFDAAHDMGQCVPCTGTDSEDDDMGGIGNDCPHQDPTGTHPWGSSCLQSGRIDVACCHDYESGTACGFKPGITDGVVCCWEQCGDGIVAFDEECDDGDADNFDGCTTSCTLCGNGNVTLPEGCDDGNLDDGDGCDSNCTPTGCGNAVVTEDEECDDGNGEDFDGCTNACTICGNGIVKEPEECDDGNRSSEDACRSDCRSHICGDGFHNPWDEECDDGNADEFDGCSTACTVCGNGVVTAPEECDDGNLHSGDGCTSACTVCGDGVVTPPESCDDGNRAGCDGCSADCQITAACGDGTVDANCREGCDDGNVADGDGCDSNCTPTACGNGVVTEGEECDDGNSDAFDGCTTACTVCGDGVVTPPEECDDGNADPFDGCNTACTICGDGIVTPPEQCDDGNLIDGDACDAGCLGPRCGNVTLDDDEECDDGGICIGGANAGASCTSHSQCPVGRCTPFGGDGCAANCTTETDVMLMLGLGTEAVPRAFFGAWAPLPYGGPWTLTVGARRPNALGHMEIPVVIKEAEGRRMRIPLLGCACLRGVAAKTCGGTLFDADGATPSTDCTDGFADGPGVCPAERPCTFVHGPGNAASGVVGCESLAGVHIDFTQDCGGRGEQPAAPSVTSSGIGGPGSAVFHTTTATGLVSGDSCSGSAFEYGPDGEFCTDDDPQRARGTAVSAPLTTGTATGLVLNARGGETTVPCHGCEPLMSTGGPISCDALEDGGGVLGPLVGAFTVCDQEWSFDDMVVITRLHVTSCLGDCDADASVAVNELVTLVQVALGTSPMADCHAGDADGDGELTVDELISAVKNALGGCPA